MNTTDDFYLLKSGDTTVNEENIIRNEHGFLNYKIIDGEFVVCQVCGNGKYWDDFLKSHVKALGYSRYSFYTRRNPAAFKRKYGFNLIGYVLGKEV